jgi:hypothetical protein
MAVKADLAIIVMMCLALAEVAVVMIFKHFHQLEQ